MEETASYLEAIEAIYEDSVHTADERVCNLESDTLDLLIAYQNECKQATKATDPEELHKCAQSNIWQLLSALIASTADKGIYLSEDFIKKYDKVEFVGFDFGNYVRESYSVRKWKPQHKAPETQQQPSEIAGGQLAGNGNETRPEPTAKPVVKEQLPTIYDDEVNKAKEQHVFYNAITSKNKWMTINADGYSYTWNKKKKYLAYLCGRLYWGDKVCLDKVAMKQSGEGYEIFKLDKSTESLEESDELCNLFGGIDVSNNRSQLKEPPDKWREIDKLFE